MRIAILDDYQQRALGAADWKSLGDDVEITVFDHHLGSEDAVAEALAPFDVIVAMRERTAFPASLIARLPALRLLVTTGLRNLSIDSDAARARGIDVCGTPMTSHAAFEHTRGGFCVTDIGFYGSDHNRLFRPTVFFQHRINCLHFNWITERSTRTMRFQIIDLRRLNSGAPQGLPDDAFLGLRIGSGEPAAESVVSDGGTADHRQNGIAIALGVRQPTERDDTAALAADITVRTRVEGSRMSAGRKRPQLAGENKSSG